MPVEEDFSSHATARGMLLLAAKDIVSAIAAAGFFLVIARLLPSIADLGVLTGLHTLIVMFVILSGLGIPHAATRFISTFIGSGERDKALNLYPLIFVFSTAFAAIFSLLLFMISSEISDVLFHDSANVQLIHLTSIDVFLYSLLTTCIFLLTASMEFKRVTYISILNSILKYTISFVLLMLGLELNGIVLGFVIGDAIALALFIHALRPKVLRRNIGFSSSVSELGAIMRYALSIYGFQVIGFLSLRIDVYLLMVFSTMYMVGIYSPVAFAEIAFFIILSAMDQALFPVTSRIFGKSGVTSFKDSAKYVSRYLFLFYFPLGFALAASTPTLVTITIGERFNESIYPIVIAIISITLFSPSVLVQNLLRSAGHTGVLLKSGAISLLVQTVISIVTIPLFGVLGVSSARAVSRFIVLVIPAYALEQINGLSIDRIALRNGLAASVICSVVIIGISTIVPGPSSLILQYLAALVSFLVFFRLVRAMDDKDIELIENILSGKLKWLTDSFAKIVLR